MVEIVPNSLENINLQTEEMWKLQKDTESTRNQKCMGIHFFER